MTHLLPHIHSCAKLLIIQIIVNSPDLLFLFLKRASLNFDHKTNPNWQFTMEFINEVHVSLGNNFGYLFLTTLALEQGLNVFCGYTFKTCL